MSQPLKGINGKIIKKGWEIFKPKIARKIIYIYIEIAEKNRLMLRHLSTFDIHKSITTNFKENRMCHIATTNINDRRKVQSQVW